MKKTQYATAKTAAAVVLNSGEDETAAITQLTVKPKRKYVTKRLSFAGKVTFDKKTASHIEKNILPMVDKITGSLGLDRGKKAWQMSIVNPAIASVADKRLVITGFSADVPVFLALLSAALNIPLAQDFVATGHIASADGIIKPVRALAAKIEAARLRENIARFIIPVAEADTLDICHAGSVRQIDIIPYAKRFFDIIQADNISGILDKVFSAGDIVICSLENNFFEPPSKKNKNNTLAEAVNVFTDNNDKRFWETLRNDLNIGDTDNIKKLLSARVDYHIANKSYPKKFGSKLAQAVLAVPASIRRTKLSAELVDIKRYFDLCRFADEDDLKTDSRYLRDAFEGLTAQKNACQFLPDNTGTGEQEATDADLENIFSQISEKKLSEKITLPLDSARAAYVLEKITVDSAEEFLEQITSFYIYLIGHTTLAPARIDRELMRASALSLVERTFNNHGGFDAACQEAIDGFSGGVNLIINQVTERFKFEQKTGHIDSVLARAVDQNNIEERIKFTKKLLAHIGPWLPAEIRSRDAATLVDRYPEIIKAYVNSLDMLKQKLRAF